MIVRAAGRAERQSHRAARACEHDRRRHAASAAACRGATSFAPPGDEVEVGELVVEQEAAHHDAAAEGCLDGGGHRGHVALRVDDREMAGAAPRCRRAAPCASSARRSAWLSHPDTSDPRDAPTGTCWKAGIAEIARAIGIGQPARLGEKMHRFGRLRRRAREGGALEDAEDLQHARRRPALGGAIEHTRHARYGPQTGSRSSAR